MVAEIDTADKNTPREGQARADSVATAGSQEAGSLLNGAWHPDAYPALEIAWTLALTDTPARPNFDVTVALVDTTQDPPVRQIFMAVELSPVGFAAPFSLRARVGDQILVSGLLRYEAFADKAELVVINLEFPGGCVLREILYA